MAQTWRARRILSAASTVKTGMTPYPACAKTALRIGDNTLSPEIERTAGRIYLSRRNLLLILSYFESFVAESILLTEAGKQVKNTLILFKVGLSQIAPPFLPLQMNKITFSPANLTFCTPSLFRLLFLILSQDKNKLYLRKPFYLWSPKRNVPHWKELSAKQVRALFLRKGVNHASNFKTHPGFSLCGFHAGPLCLRTRLSGRKTECARDWRLMQ
jgi:hypothetical protein